MIEHNIDEKKQKIDKLFQEAIDCSNHQNYSRALDLFIKILEIEPEQPRVMFNAAVMCDLLGEIHTAIQVLKEAIKLQPDFPNSHFYLGKIYFRFKEYDSAATCFRNSIKYDITNKEAYQLYSDSLEKIGQSVIDDHTDLVFYIIGGRPFNGDSIKHEGVGGSESALIYITRELVKLGYRIKVFTMCDKLGTYNGVEYFDLVDFYIYKNFNQIKTFISARSIKPFQVGINANVKMLWVHDNPNIDLSPEIIQQINRIFFVSEWHKKQWQDEYNIPGDKLAVTRNGVDISIYEKYTNSERKNKFLYISQPQRGLEHLLEIFPKIREDFPDSELHVFYYESSSIKSTIEQLKTGKDLSNVFFRGSISKHELAAELSSAKLLLYPTHFLESSCIAAIEAQAAGTPVITTNLAALSDTVQHEQTGILIKGLPNTRQYRDEFISQTKKLLNNRDLWLQMNKNCYEYSKEKYDWNIITKLLGEELKKF